MLFIFANASPVHALNFKWKIEDGRSLLIIRVGRNGHFSVGNFIPIESWIFRREFAVILKSAGIIKKKGNSFRPPGANYLQSFREMNQPPKEDITNNLFRLPVRSSINSSFGEKRVGVKKVEGGGGTQLKRPRSFHASLESTVFD